VTVDEGSSGGKARPRTGAKGVSKAGDKTKKQPKGGK